MSGTPPLLTEARLRQAIAALPGLPPLVCSLLAELEHADNLNFSVLSQRICADQGLAMRILRLANSSFYGLSGRVASIDDAIVILGLRTLYTLALNAAALRAMTRPPCAGFAEMDFWRHSIAVAVAARAGGRLPQESGRCLYPRSFARHRPASAGKLFSGRISPDARRRG